MVYAFDSLGYAKRLRDRGIPQEQAEAHAEAARDFIMAELVTKPDLLAVKADLQSSLASLEARFDAKIENLSLQLTVRLGAMIVVAIGALATILKLTY
ncbi:MAG TPA: hypothetical protein VEM36_12880 [Xanthobacteraceae bacterium]|nr:hypothetical protein [Xanthobacteraceae bacterium]